MIGYCDRCHVYTRIILIHSGYWVCDRCDLEMFREEIKKEEKENKEKIKKRKCNVEPL